MKLPTMDFSRIKRTPFAVKSLTTAYFRRYHNRPAQQEKFLLKQITQSAQTAFGKKYWFIRIATPQDYQQSVPVNHYDDLYPWIDRCLHGEKNILVRGNIQRFATSSGTTGSSKYIPVTNGALRRNHFRAWADLMMLYAKNNPHTKIWQWQWLVIGWGFVDNPFNKKKNIGYISAILQKTSPLIGKLMKQPKPKISYLGDWRKKVERMIEVTRRKNITSISGQPSRCSAYLERMLETTWKENILQTWKNLELVIWWGMAIDLYQKNLHNLLPSPNIRYYQVYNASEWFFALQDQNDRDDMLLLVEHAVFYEFIPFEKYIRKDYSEALLLDQIKIGEQYVIVITNNAWLRRYVLGDVIVFIETTPYRIKIVGRTKYYIDVAWECTPLQPIIQSLQECVDIFWGEIKEYTIAPGEMEKAHDGHYELLIERIWAAPCTAQAFAEQFDRSLCKNYSLYDDERHDTKMLQSPQVSFVPTGTFYKRLEKKGKLGWQHKIPKVSNERTVLSECKELGKTI